MTSEGIQTEAGMPTAYERALEEYKLIQRGMLQMMNDSMKIKNWSVTICTAGIAAAYVQHISELLLIAAFTSIVFWITDAHWRSYLRSFWIRSKEIEDFFTGQTDSYIGPQLDTRDREINKGIRKGFYLGRFALRPSVVLPHSLMFLGSISLYTLDWLQIISVGEPS